MNTTFRAGWLAIALLVCAANSIFSQSISEDLRRADKQFDLYAYNLALKTYKQVLEKDANNGHALGRIADSYFQLNQPEESLSWYRRAVEQREPNSDVQLRYGKALMLRGDYEQARKQFLEYAALNDNANEVGRHYVQMTDYAVTTARKTPEYSARNEALNTSAADFSPVFLGTRVVYSSARTDIVRQNQPKSSSDWSGSSSNQLFVTQRTPENGSLQKPVFLRNDLQNIYNEGPVSFSADGKKVAFCRNNFINGTRQIADKGLNMSLYVADVNNGDWNNVKAFPFNGSDYATGFPCLVGNGNTLMFASNNPNSTTGGKGWDLYVSNLVNGEWSTPRNLGAPVNTIGNEVTPFYDGNYLYFSSDWHNGLGGLDVFRADVGKENVGNIQHLGPGINSSYDDYGFVFASPQKLGYLTSNRPSGRGNEDIWQIAQTSNSTATANAPTSGRSLGDALRIPGNPVPTQNQPDNAFSPQTYSNESGSTIQSYYLLVTDAFGTPLPGVDVDMSQCNGERGQTDTEGKFYFTPPATSLTCLAELNKAGYENSRVEVREFGRHNITASLPLDNRKEFSGLVLDDRNRLPLSDVTIEFADKGKTIQTTSDVNGRYSLMLAPGDNYVVLYSKYGFVDTRVSVRPVISGTVNQIPTAVLGTGTQSGNTSPNTYSNFGTTAPSTVAAIPIQNGNAAQKWTTPSTYSTYNNNRPNTTTIASVIPPTMPIEFNGYSVQLSAVPASAGDSEGNKYQSLAKHGNIYTKAEEGKNKIRLGIFSTKEQAQKVLKEINKTQQTKGAFVVEEYDADKSLLMDQSQNTAAAPTQYSTTAANTRGITKNDDIRYAIQMIALSSDKPVSLNDYSSVSNLGNVYGKMENGSLKMRLGVWDNYSTAETTLAEVNRRGFKDALIVTEKATDENIKGYLISSSPATQTAPIVYSTQPKTTTVARTSSPAASEGSKYYVRICALADPGRFDADKLEGAGVNGTVEKWPVGNTGLTAIMLAGYTSLDAAKRDKEKLRTSGFPEAYVVRENKGTVSREN